MATSRADCIRAVISNSDMTPDEAARFVDEMYRNKDGSEIRDGDSLLPALESFFDKEDVQANLRRQSKATQLARFEFARKFVADYVRNDPTGKVTYVDAIEAFMVGNNMRLPGARESIAGAQIGEMNFMLGQLGSAFEKIATKRGMNRNGIHKILADPESAAFQQAFLMEIFYPGTSGDELAREVAGVYMQMKSEIRQRLRDSGVIIEELPYGHFPQAVDYYKLIDRSHGTTRQAQRSFYVDFIYDKIDWNQTFPDIEATMAARKEALGNIFDSMVTGHDPELNGYNPHRTLHFLNGEAAFEYLGMYGKGSMLSSISHEVWSYGRRLALFEALGPQPMENMQKLITWAKKDLGRQVRKTGDLDLDKIQADQMREEFGTFEDVAGMYDNYDRLDLEKQLALLDRAWNDEGRGSPTGKLWNYMMELTGETSIPSNPTLASITQWMRAFQSISKLGMAAVSSITDTATTFAAQKRVGVTFQTRMWNALFDYFRTYSPDERQVLTELGFLTNVMFGQEIARFEINGTLPQRLSAITNKFYQWSLLQTVTERKKAAHALTMSRLIGQQGHLVWADMDLSTRSYMELFGFTEQKWDVIRKYMIKEVPGLQRGLDDGSMSGGRMLNRPMLVSDGTADIPDTVLEAFIPENLRGSKSDELWQRDRERALREARTDFQTDVMRFFADDSKFAVLEADAKIRAWANQGTRPGTPTGDVFRAVMQFKSFPLMWVDRQIGGKAWVPYGTTHATVGENIPGIVPWLGSMIIVGYVAQTIKDLLRGQTPKEILSPEHFAATMMSSLWQSGFGGLYGDALLNPGAGTDDVLLGLLKGPTVDFVFETTDTAAKLLHGDFEGAGKTAAWTAINNIPFGNFWMTKAALDWMVMNEVKERLSPGYNARLDKRIMDQYGQVRILGYRGDDVPAEDAENDG